MRAGFADNGRVMDLVNAIVTSQQQQLDSQVQFAAARQILKAQRQEGSAALELLNAADVSGEKAVDTLAVAASGVGGNVDTYA
jgi:hypothetical protein